MLRKSHVGIRRQKPLLRTKITKKGKDTYPSPSSVIKTAVKLIHLYLVLVPSSFFSIGAPPEGWSAGPFISPLGAAGSAGAGAAGAGAGGGGGGGACSSFLPHPANVSIKAKRVVPDNRMILFPILSSPPFPTHLWKTVLLDHFLLHNCGSLARGFMKIRSHKGAQRM